MRTAGSDGKMAAHRVNKVRNLFFNLINDTTDFIEIGAHHAEASSRFISEGKDRRAFAFEPISSIYEEAKILHRGKPIFFQNVAIGAEDGNALFRIPKNPNLKIWGSLNERNDISIECSVVPTRMLTLDSAVKLIGAKKLLFG